MRRILLVLLIMLTLGQGSWARAAAYCLHESAPAVRHFGHHTHVHQPGQAAVQGVADSDCGVCHLGTAGAPPPVQTTAAVTGHGAPRAKAGPQSIAAHPEQPDRPNWRSLA